MVNWGPVLFEVLLAEVAPLVRQEHTAKEIYTVGHVIKEK